MAYLRPAMPLEIDPTSSAMSDALVFAFGTEGTGLTSFGRAAVTATLSATLTHNTDSVTVPTGFGQQRMEMPGANLNSGVLTAVIVFDKPAGQAHNIALFNSNNADTGGGYAVGSMEFNVFADGGWSINRANQANIITGAAGNIVVGRNVAVVTRRADNTIAVSINGGAVVNGAASDYTFGTWSFGCHDRRDKDLSTVTYHWFAHSPTASSDQQLVDLSTNPTMMTRTVGSGAADTTPPTLVSATSDAYGENVTLVFSEGLTAQDVVESSITITGTGAHSVTLATVGGANVVCAVTPPIAVGEAFTVSYNGTGGIVDTSNNAAAAFGPVSGTNNTTMSRPSLAGYTLKTFGDEAFTDFKTEADLYAWLLTHNPPEAGKPTMIWFYKDINLGNRQWGPTYSTDSHYVTGRPAPGLSYKDLEPDTAPGALGTVGLRATVSGGRGHLRVGMVLEDMRIRIETEDVNGGFTLRRDGWGHGGNVIGLRSCRIEAVTQNMAMSVGEYGCNAFLDDCLFVHNHVSNNASIIKDGGGSTIDRCTFVRRMNTGNMAPAVAGFDRVRDSVFSQCGPDVVGDSAGLSNNYTDTAQNTQKAGVTFVLGNIFQDYDTNFRPWTGSLLVGGASSSAISKPDNNGNNRGTSPDAGAFQLTPAQPLATGTLTRYDVDGSSLLVTVDTDNVVDSASISLTAVAGSGGVSMGPLALTLTPGFADIEVNDIVPGEYKVVILLTNGGGTNSVPGTGDITILGVGGGTQDPGTSTPATAITLSNQVSNASVGTPTSPMRLGLNGVHSGTVTVTATDNDGGVINPSSPQIINGEAVNFTYTPASAGTKTLTFSNDAGLVNPSPLQITVAAVQMPPPTVSISTADVNVLMGARATVGGALDLKADAGGTIELFRDPLPSGAPVKFTGQINLSSGTWTAQWPDLPVGEFRLRAVVTANSQTSSAQTGPLRIAGATGVVNVPIA